ncbi:MAG: phytanoyl-CoA dioxygenase family protein [Actinomycetota bacterium]|nr:phytanoyl-CoA dioxygenase family protein [Actinomycetota bacterium]
MAKHPELTGEARRVLDDLERNGAAVTSVEALLGSDGLWGSLRDFTERLEQSKAGEIEEARRGADEEGPGKSYLMSLLPSGPIKVTPENEILARFALQEPLLAVANAYYGLYVRLRTFDVWHTFASSRPARDSQLWHRDPANDEHLLKVFVYLTDVDEGAGPFMYAAGTHPQGDVKAQPRSQRVKGADRTTDEEMAAVVPPERWVKGVGPASTIVLADTRGYHKGGEARNSDRILYYCMYRTPAFQTRRFTRPITVSAPLGKEQRVAVSS